jgi:hypothetical protein
MYIVAYLRGKEIARKETSTILMPDGKYDIKELGAFWHETIDKYGFSFDNSVEREYFVRCEN